jgi:IS5 family transposase
MVQRRQRERSLFEVLLPDGHKLWPDWLRKIDTLLEDEGVIEAVAQGLEARWPQSRRRGRPGIPAEVVLRMLILKHLFDWSYDDLEREVRANLVYRMFTRIDAGDVPDAKTILKIARALGPDVIGQLHRQVIEVAKRAGVTHGRRFRVDTTVVETNVHYPTDSTLLQDGMRVLTPIGLGMITERETIGWCGSGTARVCPVVKGIRRAQKQGDTVACVGTSDLIGRSAGDRPTSSSVAALAWKSRL